MKKTLLAIALVLMIFCVSITAGASTISITGLNGWTPVQYTINGATHNSYAGEFLLTIDGFKTSGYCVDLYDTTYVPSGPYYNIDLAGLDFINKGSQAAWLMNEFSGKTAVENAALQVAIWEIMYPEFEYTGGGAVGGYLSTYLAALGENVYSGACYQVVDFEPYAQDLLVRVPAPVPEPATLLLLGSGLIGLAGFRRKKS